eukprot:4511099-Pleurochrysis_carterae.AAC.1
MVVQRHPTRPRRHALSGVYYIIVLCSGSRQGDHPGRAKKGQSVGDTGSCCQGAGSGAGAGRTHVGGSGLGARSGEVGHARYGKPERGIQSASAPRVHMRCQCNFENYA